MSKQMRVLILLTPAVLAGCNSETSAAPAEPVAVAEPLFSTTADWLDGGGQETLDDLSRSMGFVSDAAMLGSPELLAVACEDLRDTVQRAQAFTPVPVESVRGPYEAGLVEFGNSAEACIAGARSDDPDLIYEAIEHNELGKAYIEEATAAIEAY